MKTDTPDAAERAEILRQADAGMTIEAMGARFQRPYGQLADVLCEELHARADRWAREGRA